MKQLNKASMAVMALTLGCGGSVEGPPKPMGLVMDGFNLSCADINSGQTPFAMNHYCGEGQETAFVQPSAYATHAEEFRDALNCVFSGLLKFELQQAQQAPQTDVNFIGGMSQDESNYHEAGDAISYPDGHFYTYVVDTNSQGGSFPACQILVAELHEIGHGLLNKALPQRNFEAYGLDEHGHDPANSPTVMAPQTICLPAIKFSEATAQIIEENLHPNNPQPIRLENIAERCAPEIGAVVDLPTPPAQ